MKKGTSKSVSTIESTVDQIVESNETTSTQSQVKNVESNTDKILGRPVDPNSNRQKHIKEMEQRRANGELKRGRPIVEGCKRQQVLEERAKKIASGVELKKGRPIDPNSPRQVELRLKAERAAARALAVTESK